MSLRKTDVIHTPQHSLPANHMCQYTCHGFAPDIPCRGDRERAEV